MRRMKILFAEEHERTRSLIMMQFKKCDFIEVEEGKDALKQVIENKPDLILLSLKLRGMDGLSVLTILKKNKETKQIPIIMLLPQDMTDFNCLDKGADDFLMKPLNFLEVNNKIKIWLKMSSLQEDLKSAKEVIVSLISTCEEKDAYSERHSRKTAYYAKKIAEKVMPNQEEWEDIHIAGLFHDIGKISVHDNILTKPSRLTSDEYEAIKCHPVMSEKICSIIPSFKKILPSIRHHHENYDGTGYPDQLVAQQIPLGARILAVADAFDALTSPRAYRQAFTETGAIQVLKQNSSVQWDPELVRTFAAMIENKEIEICK